MMTPAIWNQIRESYRELTPVILAGKGRGVDPYFLNWVSLFTPIETEAWGCIRGHGVSLFPQFPVLNYFIDSANPYNKIGLELDGEAWHDEKKDLERDRRLFAEGWRIFRVSGKEAAKYVLHPDDEYLRLERDTPEYDEAKESWLQSVDGVVSALKSVFFRPDREHPDYQDFCCTLRTHCLLSTVRIP